MNSASMLSRTVVCLFLSGLASACAQSNDADPAGTLERIRVFGESLEGNLEGDDPTRDVFVYLPPSYVTQPNRRFPVIYFLHGYASSAESYVGFIDTNVSLDQALDRLRVPHTFEVYEGDHVNRVRERFAAKVLPFFSRALSVAEPAPRGETGN